MRPVLFFKSKFYPHASPHPYPPNPFPLSRDNSGEGEGVASKKPGMEVRGISAGRGEMGGFAGTGGKGEGKVGRYSEGIAGGECLPLVNRAQ